MSPQRAMQDLLKRKTCSYLSEEDKEHIQHAFVFAERAHKGQTRKSGERYIYHPIEVAQALCELQMDVRTVMAALLHDVIEDCDDVDETVIRERFGEDVAKLVDGVSKIGQIRFESKEQAEAENFRKMIMAMSKDVRVMVIKLADRMHNMRTLESMTSTAKQRISKQTLEVYAPIAERLGLYHWARELQDLCFRYLYPKRFSAISKELKSREGNRKRIVEKLHTSLMDSMSESGIENPEIFGRRKTVFSIYKKMQAKRRSFNDLYDIYGFRIIVDSVEDCYRTLGTIHNSYKPIPGRFADYIAIPKANGYQSLHTVVIGPLGDHVEVQIRTRRMDQIAEAGVAAHWIYKSDAEHHEPHNHLARQWLLDLLDPAYQTENAVEFLEHLKSDLYPDEVYVFTPKGDIKKMPRGATALDFAYAVHTDVGTHCTGARINKNLVSMPTLLHNGDQIEIITAKRARPTTAWLSYAITAKARTQIRNYLKQQTQEDALKLGKRLLAGATKQRLLGRRKIPAAVQSRMLEELKLDTWSDLLIDIGLGKRLPNMVARQISQLRDQKSDGEMAEQEALVIRGSEGLLVTYSKCCGPIPGDSVVGMFTAGHGLAIHRVSCPNFAELSKHAEDFLAVEWGEKLRQQFQTKLNVRLKHTRGSFAKVATAIAENGSNIIHVDLQDDPKTIKTVEFVVEVKDRIHLAQIMRALHRLSSVQKVSRQRG